MYRLLIEKRAARFIAKLTERDRILIFNKLDQLKINPYNNSLDIKNLEVEKAMITDLGLKISVLYILFEKMKY